VSSFSGYAGSSPSSVTMVPRARSSSSVSCSLRPVATGKRRLQLAQPFAAVTGTVFDRPNSGIGPPTPTSELFVTRTILHQEVAEVLLTVSQSSPSVAT